MKKVFILFTLLVSILCFSTNVFADVELFKIGMSDGDYSKAPKNYEKGIKVDSEYLYYLKTTGELLTFQEGKISRLYRVEKVIKVFDSTNEFGPISQAPGWNRVVLKLIKEEATK